MKILKLKFKNINSLVGENEIDFSDAVFKNNGLFAITGKTGSGKSSILDAISLALFGKTPRVDVTGSENAVLTRGEKDCYAEIVFEVAGKKWKSSWKQEINRNGNLNPVRRQIADAEDKIIADQVRTCDTKIVNIIGLTFEQFTKVILLAQGSFAAFLQADKNSKGELLEQITGTEIYAEISKKTYERNKTEKEKLDKISIELEAIKILSETEIQEITAEITDTEAQKKQIDSQLSQIEIAKKWLEDIEKLQGQINEDKQKLPNLEEKSKEAAANFEAEVEKLRKIKEEQENQQPIFIKVREWDGKIADRKKNLQPILTKINELTDSIKKLSADLENKGKELEASENSLNELQNWSAENSTYKELVTGFSAIETENRQLEKSGEELQEIVQEIAELKKEVEAKNTDLKNATALFDEKEKELTEQVNTLETKRADQNQILDGKKLTDLQNEKDSISDFGITLSDFIKNEKAISAHQTELKNQNERLGKIRESETELSKNIETETSKQTELKHNIELLEENIELTRTIRSLDEHRQHLVDGKECPLCGSMEHPFAVGNVPQMGNKELELVQLKKKNEEFVRKIQTAERKLTSLETEKNGLLISNEREQELLNNNLSGQTDLLSKMKQTCPGFDVPKEENRIEVLEQVLSEKRVELKHINAQIEGANKIEAEILSLRDEVIPKLNNEKEDAITLKNDAKLAQKTTLQNLTNQEQLFIKKNATFKNEKESFLEKLKKYAVEDIQELKKCLDDWNENTTDIEKLTTTISALKNNIALDKQKLENQQETLKEKQQERVEKESELKNLSDKRTDIFGEKSVEAEESNLKKLVDDTEISKEKAEQIRNDSQNELNKIKAIINDRETELLKKQKQQITEKTTEELQPKLNDLKANSESLSQKIGANKQLLDLNSENLKISGNKLKEKERQQKIYNKWGRLSSLIGSADGKLYRNFAQALTFEHLIGLANKQLQKMSERYILKRTDDNANPFELSVIDNFQNSELRTAQNLSGGEKFIISLSLALGLASMASKNMRIDTMFIDEGFGTLDSDYLDLALNALSNLQSEGKIIGVISHLTELKERIATHMEVIPIGNGHSKIQLTY